MWGFLTLEKIPTANTGGILTGAGFHDEAAPSDHDGGESLRMRGFRL